MTKIIIVLTTMLTFLGCSENKSVQRDVDLTSVDKRSSAIDKTAKHLGLKHVLSIDHSRLAKKEAADLAASKVDLYSDTALNTALIEQNILVGLDLPFRVISYAENDTVKTTFTDATFLQKRHNLLKSDALTDYEVKVASLVKNINDAKPVSSKELTHNYGIVQVESDYDFDTTISNLKRDILAEGDTIWFLTLDYKKEAKKIGQELPEATLLVFGAPSPGAKAMSGFSSIGLDAFGQKVLVYSKNDKVIIAYNDIVDFAQLHYEDNAIVHRVINFRLGKTLSNAIEK